MGFSSLKKIGNQRTIDFSEKKSILENRRFWFYLALQLPNGGSSGPGGPSGPSGPRVFLNVLRE